MTVKGTVAAIAIAIVIVIATVWASFTMYPLNASS